MAISGWKQRFSGGSLALTVTLSSSSLIRQSENLAASEAVLSPSLSTHSPCQAFPFQETVQLPWGPRSVSRQPRAPLELDYAYATVCPGFDWILKTTSEFFINGTGFAHFFKRFGHELSVIFVDTNTNMKSCCVKCSSCLDRAVGERGDLSLFLLSVCLP